MKNLCFLVLFICVFFTACPIAAQNLLLNPPTSAEVTVPEFKHTYVNDYGDLLSDGEEIQINNSLRHYEDTTSNQIIVLTLRAFDNETHGPLFDYSHKVFTTWGIGQKTKNNGILLVIVKKLSSNNAPGIRIIPGYGLEGALPDVTCRRVAENIRPLINGGNYEQGIVQAINTMQANIKGEFEADIISNVDKASLTNGNPLMWIITIVIWCLVFYILYRMFFRNKKNTETVISEDYNTGNNYQGLSRKYNNKDKTKDRDRDRDSGDTSLLAASFISYSDNDSSSSYSGDSSNDSGCDCGGGGDGGGGGGD